MFSDVFEFFRDVYLFQFQYKKIETITNKQQEDIKTIYFVLPYLNSKVEEFGFNLENLIKKILQNC